MAFSGGMLFLYARLVPMGQGSEPSEQFKRATFMSLMIAFSAVFAITMTFDMLSFRILCALLGGAALWQKIGYMFLRPFVFQSPPSIGAGRAVGSVAYGVGFGSQVSLRLQAGHGIGMAAIHVAVICLAAALGLCDNVFGKGGAVYEAIAMETVWLGIAKSIEVGFEGGGRGRRSVGRRRDPWGYSVELCCPWRSYRERGRR